MTKVIRIQILLLIQTLIMNINLPSYHRKCQVTVSFPLILRFTDVGRVRNCEYLHFRTAIIQIEIEIIQEIRSETLIEQSVHMSLNIFSNRAAFVASDKFLYSSVERKPLMSAVDLNVRTQTSYNTVTIIIYMTIICVVYRM